MDERMKNLNLAEILKDFPEGTKLYSPIFGEVELVKVHNNDYPIEVKLSNNTFDSFTKDGRIYMDYDGECMLFPSKDQRDWGKFKPNKYKFDPNILKSFDRVLVRDSRKEKWQCSIFSYINNDDIYYPYVAITTGFKCCIPYNEETKHLIGTVEEAPEFYRYWKE